MPEKLTKEELLEQIKKAQTGLAEVRRQREAEEAALGIAPTTVASSTAPEAVVSPSADLEEAGIKKEIENLPKEVKKSLFEGLSTIGFEVEKWKNDKFSKTYDWLSRAKDKNGQLVPKKGALANFLRARSKRHKINSENAANKASLVKDAPIKSTLTSAAYLSKNVLRLGGWVAAVTGMAPALGYRIAMTASMAAPSIAGDMKEARFRNEKLIESTRMELENAENEAWALYENAGGNIGDNGERKIVALENIKKAYLESIPEDLKTRLGLEVAGESVLKMRIRDDINLLRTELDDIEKDEKLSPEKKESKKNNLLKRWEENLNDYDRALTRIGTVDQMAIRLQGAEATAKYVLRGMTAYTAAISLERIWSLFDHSDSGSLDILNEHPNKEIIRKAITQKMDSMKTSAGITVPIHIDAGNTSEVPGFKSVEITFDKGKGGLQGILDLKDKLKAEYPDLSKAPEGVRKFIEGDFVEQAKSKGLKFLSEDGKSSLKIFEGATLKLDAEGNPVFTNLGSNEEVYIANKVEAVKPGEFVGPPEPEKVTPEPAPVAADTETPNKTLENNPKAEALKKLGYSGDPKDIVAVNRFLKDDFFASHDIERPLSTPESLQDAADTAVETIRQNRQNVLDQYPVQPEISDAGRHIEPLEHFFGYTKGVAGNPLNLSDKTLEAVDETYSRNIAKFFEDPNVGWTRIKMLPAHNVLKYNGPFAYKGFTFDQKDAGPVSQYLRKLVEVTGLKPKNSWFFGRESVQHYMARALQKAADKGYLEKLK